MTQAFNLSQLANFVNTSGQLSLTTGVTGVLPIANGGSNNGSLAVTAGGIIYTDGSKMVNVGAGTDGYFLKSNGAGAPSWASLSVSGTLKNIQYFTSGSATYTPTSGTTFVVVEVVGGGGGSSWDNAGTANTGGTSSFGALVSATGGAGANSSGTSGTFNGGSGSGGDINASGYWGFKGQNLANQTGTMVGGTSFFGGAYGSGGYANRVAAGGNTMGVGAGGGYARKKITSGFSGVTVTVGAGGTGANGGTQGITGRAGIVIVYEYA